MASYPPYKIKNPSEMDAIRRKQAIVDEEIARSRKPEKNVAKSLAYFEIARYTTGSFKGLFVVWQLITEDAKGHTLKKPEKKVVADGVDMFVAITSLETALRRRVYR